MDRVIYHIKTLSVVIRTTLENVQKIVPVSRKTSLKLSEQVKGRLIGL